MPSVLTGSLSRRETKEGTQLDTVYIVGIAVVGVIVVCVALWLAIRQYRRRIAREKQKKHESAFIPVPRLAKDSVKSSGPSTPLSPLYVLPSVKIRF
jgi:flagellar biosynthesis/type III secretory pathway M-ring protein FliF/YscJ